MFKFVVAIAFVAVCSASVYVPSDYLLRDGIRPSGGFALRATGERGPASTIPAEYMAAAPVVPAVTAVEYVAPAPIEYVAPAPIEYVAPAPIEYVAPVPYVAPISYIPKPIESSYSYARVAQGYY